MGIAHDTGIFRYSCTIAGDDGGSGTAHAERSR